MLIFFRSSLGVKSKTNPLFLYFKGNSFNIANCNWKNSNYQKINSVLLLVFLYCSKHLEIGG